MDSVKTSHEENGDKARKEKGDCAPEDIVSSLSVRYQGDYVFSQLLQWYNAGIGHPPGLPDLIGCAILPRVSDCFDSELVRELKGKSDRKTLYEAKVVPALVSWFQDPYQRGSAWPALIQRAFNGPELRQLVKDSKDRFLPFGSPVVDFLVTGNESNITAIIKELDSSDKMTGASGSDKTLLTSVDKGRPAQAVSTWIQCEQCQKWRRVPWHVDRDTLPEKFVCSDNKWNASAQSCDSPEDDWDAADALVGDDGKVEGTPIKKEEDEKLNVLEEKSFFIGGKCAF
jgi:[histone H3]-lysine4 N-trimethyltransferase ATXR3